MPLPMLLFIFSYYSRTTCPIDPRQRSSGNDTAGFMGGGMIVGTPGVYHESSELSPVN